jgi:HK97 family phage portal protein
MINWLTRRFGEKRAVQQGNGTSWLQNVLQLWEGRQTAAGVSISETGAMTIGAVFTAVRIIGGTLASLPLHVYQRTEGGNQFAVQHWAYALLHDSPNEYHTSFTWRELMAAHLLLWGNHYSRIEWLKNGHVNALLPLMPYDVRPYRNDAGVQLYDVQLPGGGSEVLPADEMLHIPGLGYDGLKGLSVIGSQREALGFNKAMEIFSASFFKNGAKPGAILETPGRMNPEAQKNLAASLVEKFGQVDDSFKVLVLEEGSKLHTYTMPLAEAELLNSRKLSRSEIFGLYGVPPHLGGDTERQTSWGTGIEQMDIGYAKHTITPWCVRIEQEINRKLFGRRSGAYCKHSLEGLQRGDYKTRMEGYAIGVQNGIMLIDEVRELENNPPLPDGLGRKPIIAANMTTIEKLGQQPEPKPAAAPVANQE